MNTDQRIELLRLATDLAVAALDDKTAATMGAKHKAEVAAKAAGTDALAQLVKHYFDHLCLLAQPVEEG